MTCGLAQRRMLKSSTLDANQRQQFVFKTTIIDPPSIAKKARHNPAVQKTT